MKPKTLWTILGVVTLLIWTGIANANPDERVTQHDGLYTLDYGGAENADPVPLDIQLVHFIGNYDGDLVGQLTAGDNAAFFAAVRRLAWLEGMEVALDAIQSRTICRMVEAGEAPETIAEELQLFEDARVERKSSAVTEMYAALSQDGQSIVRNHLDSIGTEHFSTSRIINLPEFVKDHPGAFSARFKENCSQPLPPLRGTYIEKVRDHGSGINFRSYSITHTVE